MSSTNNSIENVCQAHGQSSSKKKMCIQSFWAGQHQKPVITRSTQHETHKQCSSDEEQNYTHALSKSLHERVTRKNIKRLLKLQRTSKASLPPPLLAYTSSPLHMIGFSYLTIIYCYIESRRSGHIYPYRFCIQG